MTMSTPQPSTLGVALLAALLLVIVGGAGEAEELKLLSALPPTSTSTIDPFLLDLQERTFRFFWETANPENGLIPDRYPTPSYSSIAAVGFGLTTYPIGVERSYITREQARQRRPSIGGWTGTGRSPRRRPSASAGHRKRGS
jgi:hypothetical protein